MISSDNLGGLMDAPVFGPDDDKIGTVGQVFVDPVDGHPNWVTVHTGLFGRHETFIPLDDATWDREALHVTFDKQQVKDAPRIDTDAALDADGEEQLYQYYSKGSDDGDSGKHDAVEDAERETSERDTTGDDTSRDDTSAHDTGSVRLRKYVVTEEETVDVPVESVPIAQESVPVESAVAPDSIPEQGVQEQGVPVQRDPAQDSPSPDVPVSHDRPRHRA